MKLANDNYFIRVGKDGKGRLPDGWQDYQKTGMTAFGPIGINGGQFQYLDPEIREWRA